MQKYIIQKALEEITGGTTLYTLEKYSKKPIISTLSGRSSGVERNLAKFTTHLTTNSNRP